MIILCIQNKKRKVLLIEALVEINPQVAPLVHHVDHIHVDRNVGILYVKASDTPSLDGFGKMLAVCIL